MKIALLSIILGSFINVSVHADPPQTPKNLWRNANDYKHYILYERSSNTWVETVNCQVFYRFTKVSSSLNDLFLYDASRKMSVRLNYDGMYLKGPTEANYTFYQKGTFEKRIYFSHQNPTGQWTGTFTKKNACAWEELLAGGTSPAWRFKEFGNTPNQSTFLYDASRNMRVRIDPGQVWLQPNGAPQYSFFKKGYWTE